MRLALLAAVTANLAACSVLDSGQVDYKTPGGRAAPTLEVPPDLTQLSTQNGYAIPGGPVSANAYDAGRNTAPALPTAVANVGDVKIQRAGQERWLVVNRTPDQLWQPVLDFWQESGFLMTTEQRNLGIMETDWAEDRAKIPMDPIRSVLGKVIDSAYSTGTLDRFRTRFERDPNGGTDIYISHRGMVEVYNSDRKDTTSWQPRPADPDLEAEMLRKLMVKLGVSDEQAKAAVASASPSSRAAQVGNVNGQPVVQISEGFDTAWRRVGLALDRTGFTVEDRNRSTGVYYVRYVTPDPNRTEPGLFSKMFGKDTPAPQPTQYLVQVKSQGSNSIVSVLNAAGAPETSANAQRIVKVIADDLKQ
jgi:outer membrane protein assembly factor BamC